MTITTTLLASGVARTITYVHAVNNLGDGRAEIVFAPHVNGKIQSKKRERKIVDLANIMLMSLNTVLKNSVVVLRNDTYVVSSTAKEESSFDENGFIVLGATAYNKKPSKKTPRLLRPRPPAPRVARLPPLPPRPRKTKPPSRVVVAAPPLPQPQPLPKPRPSRPVPLAARLLRMLLPKLRLLPRPAALVVLPLPAVGAGHPIGLLSMARDARVPFRDDEVALLEVVAHGVLLRLD